VVDSEDVMSRNAASVGRKKSCVPSSDSGCRSPAQACNTGFNLEPSSPASTTCQFGRAMNGQANNPWLVDLAKPHGRKPYFAKQALLVVAAVLVLARTRSRDRFARGGFVHGRNRTTKR